MKRIGIVLAGVLLGLPLLVGAEETVDINTADAKTLAEVLSGVGERVAQEIVAYREANGPFTRVEDLVLVRGVGERLLERNRSRLRLGEAVAEEAAPADDQKR